MIDYIGYHVPAPSTKPVSWQPSRVQRAAFLAVGTATSNLIGYLQYSDLVVTSCRDHWFAL